MRPRHHHGLSCHWHGNGSVPKAANNKDTTCGHFGKPSAERHGRTLVSLGAWGDGQVQEHRTALWGRLQHVRFRKQAAHRPEALQATDVCRLTAWAGNPSKGMPLWRPIEPWDDSGSREIQGLGNLSRRTMQGVRKAGHRSVETDGQGRIFEIKNDEPPGHHRRGEGQGDIPRWKFWTRSQGGGINGQERSGKQQKRKDEITSEARPFSIDEPSYQKGIQSSHYGRDQQESKKEAEASGSNSTPKKAKETSDARRTTQGAEGKGQPQAGRGRQETFGYGMARRRWKIWHAQEVQCPGRKPSLGGIHRGNEGPLQGHAWTLHRLDAGAGASSRVGGFREEAPWGHWRSRNLWNPRLHTGQGRCAVVEGRHEEDVGSQCTS